MRKFHAGAAALVGALAIVGVFASSSADAQPARHRGHKTIHTLNERARGDELNTSAYAYEGSENHYYSDTVGNSQTDLLDLDYRYMQRTSPHYDTMGFPLFQF